DERKTRLDQSSVLYLTFKAWDPNKTLAKIDPYLSWLFTPGFVVFSVALFVISAYLLAGDWTRVQSDTAALYSFRGKTSYDIWVFWFLMLGLGAVHEFGHGLTCKHFGGDVHQMGFMLIYFTPAFFTDTTDIVLFDRTGRRQWVIFAGIWVELVVCGIATIIWSFTVPGSFANDLAYKAMLLSGIQGTLINLNPLIKADGYYALAEYLHVDNLREDSFTFLRAWIRRYIFRHDAELPPTTRRLRHIYGVFGVTAVIYSASLTILAPFARKYDLKARYKTTLEGVTGWGVGGPSRGCLARAGTLKLGGVAVSGPVVELSLQTKGAFSDPYVAGNVGAGVLKKFNVIFDYGRQRIIFEPNAGYASRDTYDRTGMWMNLEKDAFRIIDVFAGSPAAEAGLKAGDFILMIDGMPPARLSLVEARTKFRSDPPGTRVKLLVLSGGEKRETILILKDLV
ncbi:MAG: PDZ domain-containing protein, partial [Candidatus Aminicenantales bacterium]